MLSSLILDVVMGRRVGILAKTGQTEPDGWAVPLKSYLSSKRHVGTTTSGNLCNALLNALCRGARPET